MLISCSTINNDRGGYVLYYFKAMNWTYFLYRAKDNYDYWIARITGNAGNSLHLNDSINEIDNSKHVFALYDDYADELIEHVIHYFNIINDEDDETVYAQLNASLR